MVPIPERPDVQVMVMCTVYNHERYLERCLDGFVMQKTTFPFCVLVHDDCSGDRSVSIIREYEKKYPDIILPMLEHENQYANGRAFFRIIVNSFKSPYFAICEGDDYWCDPLKLQKQYDYMETHPGCALSVHNCRVIDLSGGNAGGLLPGEEKPRVLTPEDVFDEWMVHVSSFFFRNNHEHRPEWTDSHWFGDYIMLTTAHAFGSVDFIPDIMSVHNYNNPDSVSTAYRKMDRNQRVEKEREQVTYLSNYLQHYKTDAQTESIIRNRMNAIEANCERELLTGSLKEQLEREADNKSKLSFLLEWLRNSSTRKVFMDPGPGLEKRFAPTQWKNCMLAVRNWLDGARDIAPMVHFTYVPWLVHFDLVGRDKEYLAGIVAFPDNTAGWGIPIRGDNTERKKKMLLGANRCTTEEESDRLMRIKEALLNSPLDNEEETGRFCGLLEEGMELNYLDRDLLYFKTVLLYTTGQYTEALNEIGISMLFYGEDADMSQLYQQIIRVV